ncbi:hypothetical protein AMAG_15193 [Allomyces macrogynus ATCC 38327]|uniref:Alpha/beta hydrolase fold-3 domain-containing protein n=1 Tax=Allomyces macrogynus (strain ATCC 38327) TaxID=578462 RepID=A0A0L0T647_ALLM3|nr:hypothetical protein AMAG_15193 [Allomyces macrogynus ATCC 38327]|eukprot:KNE70225.1 hypothetical protein AMAG_15193 [Allomyces macrogynus ATCC 38327]
MSTEASTTTETPEASAPAPAPSPAPATTAPAPAATTTSPTKQPTDTEKPPTWGFLLSVGSRAVLPAIGKTLVQGPKRKGRSRGLDVFVRLFHTAAQMPGMNLARARAVTGNLRKLGKRQVQQVIKKLHVEEVEWTVQLVPADAEAASPGAADAAGPVVKVRSSLVPFKHDGTPEPTTWGLKADWVDPLAPRDGYVRDRVILFLHGGAYIFGDKEQYQALVGPWADTLDRRVFIPAYRLAPEYPFPAAIHDAVSAFLYLTQVAGIAPNHITFAGDSAGGNLCMATLMWLRDHGHAMPNGAVLMSPWSDLSHSLPSYADNDGFDYLPAFGAGGTAFNPVAMYIGLDDYHEIAATNGYISPAIATDLHGMPPIYICTGSDEILLDEQVLLATQLVRDGNTVLQDIHKYGVHVFPLIASKSPDAVRARARIREFVTCIADVPVATAKQRAEITQWSRGEKVKEEGESTLPGGWAKRWPGIAAAKKRDPDVLVSELQRVPGVLTSILPASAPVEDLKAVEKKAAREEKARRHALTVATAPKYEK